MRPPFSADLRVWNKFQQTYFCPTATQFLGILGTHEILKPFQEIGALLGILHLSKLIFAHFLHFLPEGTSVFLQTEELHSLRPPFSHKISNLELKSDFRISVGLYWSPIARKKIMRIQLHRGVPRDKLRHIWDKKTLKKYSCFISISILSRKSRFLFFCDLCLFLCKIIVFQKKRKSSPRPTV